MGRSYTRSTRDAIADLEQRNRRAITELESTEDEGQINELLRQIDRTARELHELHEVRRREAAA